MPSKKPKAKLPADAANSSFLDSAWENLWGLADDTRVEVHKQMQSLIALANGAFQGAAGFANKQNDRVDELTREGISSANATGRALVSAARDASKKLRDSYRNSTTQIVTGARDNVRSVADRASATARVMIAPTEEKKAA
jgi:hypothetical protein